MTGFEPSEFDGKPAKRWGEVARRLKIVRRYLDHPQRGVEEADAAAEAIGIGRRMFYQLVETLGRHSEVNQARRKPGRRLDDAVERAIETAIAQSPPDAPFHAIGERARAFAKAQGLPPPSDSATARRVRAARSTKVPYSGERRITIDHSPLGIAARRGRTLGAPWVTVALLEGSPDPLAYVVRMAPPEPRIAVVVALDAADRTGALPENVNVDIQGATTSGWSDARRELREHGLTVTGRNHARLPNGATIRRLVGASVAGVPTRPKLAEAALAGRIDAMEPIDIDLLSDILAHRLGVPASVVGNDTSRRKPGRRRGPAKK